MPSAKAGLSTKFTLQPRQRRAHAVCVVAEYDDDRPRTLRPAPPRPRAAPWAGHRLPPAACWRRPCGSSGRPPARLPRSADRAAPVRRCRSPARGCGRDGISFSRPPAPMRMMSARLTGKIRDPALQHPVEAVQLRRAHAARQSHAHAYRRRAGRAAAGCRDRRACRNARCVPPARSIAAGMTSRRSAMADAPAIRIISAPPPRHRRWRSASAPRVMGAARLRRRRGSRALRGGRS